MATEKSQLDTIQDRLQQIEDALRSQKEAGVKRRDDWKTYAIIGAYVLVIAVLVVTIWQQNATQNYLTELRDYVNKLVAK